MLAHKITGRAREASASPSVSLEKGRYRMRAPSNRPATINETAHTRARSTSRPTSTRNSFYLVTLLLLLVAGCLVSFGFAYYLFTTRWGNWHLSSQNPADEIYQVIEVEAPLSECPTISPHDKFLAYHSHSGFHNQRIALENALVLSRLLNRTLIVPPIRLGKPIRYCNYRALHNHLALSDKSGLKHCAQIPLDSFIPPECSGYFDYTHIPWGWLVNLTDVQSQFQLILRHDPTDEWLHRCLGIRDNQVLTIPESDRYHYRFLDEVTTIATPSDKYAVGISIPNISTSGEDLLQFGTLFGSTRLQLRPENTELRRKAREKMAFSNPILLRVADAITQELHGTFIGAHVRVGDGEFLRNGGETILSIWSTLVYRVLGMSWNETRPLAALLLADLGAHSHPESLTAPYATSSPIELSSLQTHVRCRSKPHSHPSLNPLNIPLFLATDAHEPHTHPSLALIFRTFPCVFTLSDFPEQLLVMDQIVNGDDGLRLRSFLLPFLDAMVIGRASNVVGTNGSTFSAFVLDVLWRKYHGLGIRERGI
ncbi:hypothetical protein VNI00_007549 [Paramarasmius palmivorus]|uniref:O-fucosyltransferase family protein n=1 Tax=Paramarasmius palmivorus TaxID=297713 RepID=A0AAW0D076_9AGAR